MRFFTNLPKLPFLIFCAVVALKWHVIQLIAWAWMLVSFSLQHGLSRGWQMTFSGDFPCPLCRLAHNGSAWEAGFWSSLLYSQLAMVLVVIPLALVAALLPRLFLKNALRPA